MRDVKIFMITPDLLPGFLPKLWPHLKAGFAEATDVDFKREVTDIENGLTQVWAIFVDREIKGALLTANVKEDDGSESLHVYALGGQDIFQWGRALSERMVEYAKAAGCKRVTFLGRKALQKAYTDIRVVEKISDRAMFYERVVQ